MNKLCVKYKGCDNTFNSWIDKKDKKMIFYPGLDSHKGKKKKWIRLV